jgi:hypothetical protein
VKELRCPECGGLIVCTIERSNLYFFINSSGEVERDKNEDIWDLSNHINFHCSYDSTHEICSIPEWEDEFLEEIKNILMKEVI